MYWLKANWFKLILLVVASLFLFGYLYIQMKEVDRKIFQDAYTICQSLKLEIRGRLKDFDCFNQFRDMMFFRSKSTIYGLPDLPKLPLPDLPELKQ